MKLAILFFVASLALCQTTQRNGTNQILELNRLLLEKAFQSLEESYKLAEPTSNQLHKELEAGLPTNQTFDTLADIRLELSGKLIITEELLIRFNSFLGRYSKSSLTFDFSYVSFIVQFQGRMQKIRKLSHQMNSDVEKAGPLLPPKKKSKAESLRPHPHPAGRGLFIYPCPNPCPKRQNGIQC